MFIGDVYQLSAGTDRRIIANYCKILYIIYKCVMQIHACMCTLQCLDNEILVIKSNNIINNICD